MELKQILNSYAVNPETIAHDKKKVLYSVTHHEDMITFSTDEDSFSYPMGSIKEDQYNKFTGIYMIYNEYTVSTIRDVLNVVNGKGVSVFFYYDNIDMFCAFLKEQKGKTVFLESDRCLLFFSKEDIEDYFSRLDSEYPRIYLNVPTTMKNLIISKKNRDILRLRKEMDAYYEMQDLSKLKENLKILICSDLFNMGTVGCMAKDYESAFRSAEIDYELTVEDYTRFHYYEEIYFLRKVMEYKPSVVIGMNVSYASFPYYISRKLPIISQIDSGQYATNRKCYEGMGRYTVFLVPFITLENMLPENFLEEKNVIKYPFVVDYDIYKEYELTKEERDKYRSDVCVVGNSTISKEILYRDLVSTYERFFMKGIRTKKYQDFMKNLYNECFELISHGEKMLSCNEFFLDLVMRKFNERCYIWHSINKDEFSRLMFIIDIYLIMAMYRICVMNWLMQNDDIRLKIFGMRWKDDEKYNSIWGGILENGVELSKAYCASKIAIHSNLANGVHRRFFEATLSGCLCLCARPHKRLDAADLHLYFRENEEIVYFDNKQDMYQKIKYYLTHEEERKKIVRNCKRVIYEKKLDVKIVLLQVVHKAINKMKKEV